MKNILSRDNRDVLAQFAWSNTLLAFDFDGTLAPIVSDPDRAAMRARTRGLLRELSVLYPCIVISGRAHRDVGKRLRGAGTVEIIGNHGMEPWATEAHFRELVDDWQLTLGRALEPMKGIDIENKGYSLAIHYRRSREKKKAREAISRAVGGLSHARVIGGVYVVNVLPRDAPHKGIALERARERRHCDTALYVGDDETDEDVFMLERAGRLLTIRVGVRRNSAAAYCVRDQRQMDELLRALIAFRRDRVIDSRSNL